MTNYQDALLEIVLSDERYVVLTAENRAAIRDLPAVLGERFIDVGIAEQTLLGVAAGLALRGRIPIVHALAAFLTMRAFEFVRTDVGIAGLPVKLVGGVPGFLSDGNGPTHQALEDVALMRTIPGMSVFCPADEQELALGLRAVLESDGPAYIRHNPLLAFVEHDPHFEIGRAEVISDGDDVAILTYGMLLRQAVQAQQQLAAQGVSTRLLNVRTVWPIDEAAVVQAARETRLLVTLEDHFVTGGLFTIVSEVLVRRRLAVDVLPLALERWYRPARLKDALHFEGFSGPQIAERVLARLAVEAQALQENR